MATIRVYSELEATKTPVKMCSGLLPNRMQCWRAGDYLCTETTMTPAVPAHDDVAEIPESTSRKEYQLCRYHKLMQEEADLKAAQNEIQANAEAPAETKPVAESKPQTPATPPKPEPPKPTPPAAAKPAA